MCEKELLQSVKNNYHFSSLPPLLSINVFALASMQLGAIYLMRSQIFYAADLERVQTLLKVQSLFFFATIIIIVNFSLSIEAAVSCC